MNRVRLNLVLLPAALLLASCASDTPVHKPPFNHHYTQWVRVLSRCVTPDGFRYDVLKADPSALASQIAEMNMIDEAEFGTFSREERFAFLVNAHNIFTVKRIVEDYPVRSIGRTSALYPALRRSDIHLVGRNWSLLSLREEILGPRYGDSRALFVLNWGMKGCAPLPASPLTPENLHEMLEHQAQLFVRNPAYCKYEPMDRRVDVSPLLKEHREIIERDFTTLWGFMKHYASPRQAVTLESAPPSFEWMSFDKRLNDADSLPAAPILTK